MRVLFSAVPGYGHVHPLLPLASAFANAGHEVAIATGPDLCQRVRAAGLVAFETGLSVSDAFERLARTYPDGEYNRLAVDEILGFYVPHLFGEVLAPAMLEDLEQLVALWSPELLIHDVFEFAAPVAAAQAGLPSISHSLGLHFSETVLRGTSAAVAPLWLQRGLAPDPSAGLYRHLCLDIAPPALRSAIERWVRVQPLRPVPLPPLDSEHLPDWLHRRRDVPLVYMTLGTNTNTNLSVFRAVIDGVSDLDVDVLITLGFGAETTSLGSVPSNVHVAQYVPQSLVLPLCSAVICHGGAGTTLAAAAAGVPMLLLPQGADQYILSDLVVSAGACRRLRPSEVCPSAIRASVLSLLSERSYRDAAGRIQREIAAMPAPETVAAGLVEEVAGFGPCACTLPQ